MASSTRHTALKASRHVWRRLVSDRRGQGTVEFAFMAAVVIFVMMMLFSVASLGVDLMTTRYASFVGARGYMCREPQWQEGVRQVGNLVMTDQGGAQGSVSCGGEGVTARVRIKEYFPVQTLFGSSMQTTISRETCLGPKEPALDGDNMARSAPGG